LGLRFSFGGDTGSSLALGGDLVLALGSAFGLGSGLGFAAAFGLGFFGSCFV
jgi:hypothetical protein